LQEPEFEVRVVDRYHASSTVLTLVVRTANGGPLPGWEPGAHVDFLLPNGLIRQYSLCGLPEAPDRWRFGVLREENGRGGSAFIHDQIKRDDPIKIRGPRNNFQYIRGAPSLFIAGGIGITPLLPMIYAAAASGVAWRLYYGGRSRKAMAFTDELGQFGDRVALRPQDESGLLDLDRILTGLTEGERVYCCGPEALISAVESRFKSGRPGSLHVERFAAPTASPVGNAPLTVVLRRSRKTLAVSADQSILEAIEEAGIRPPCSCREGTCGTCETTVLDGRPEHRDAVLSEAEKCSGKTMMICVSRAKDPILELDL